jgi:SAM-dependent methyltransferase
MEKGIRVRENSEKIEKDFLWLNLRELPYFRGLLRAVEATYYQNYDIKPPVLDMGCGDGHFGASTFDFALDFGVDPGRTSLYQASRYSKYRHLIQTTGSTLPFADGYFQSVISNSVLEHIPDLDIVVIEIGRVTKSGGLFIFSVPNQNFLQNLSISGFLDRNRMHSLAEAYRNFFNRISRHYHCDSPETWKVRLEKAGFEIQDYWHYFSPQALHALEWGHYFGLPSLVSHWIFGRWILVPQHWNLSLIRLYTEKFYQARNPHPQGSYTFYIARKS